MARCFYLIILLANNSVGESHNKNTQINMMCCVLTCKHLTVYIKWRHYKQLIMSAFVYWSDVLLSFSFMDHNRGQFQYFCPSKNLEQFLLCVTSAKRDNWYRPITVHLSTTLWNNFWKSFCSFHQAIVQRLFQHTEGWFDRGLCSGAWNREGVAENSELSATLTAEGSWSHVAN